MAIALHRTTLELRMSVNTPDFPTETWLLNPDLSPVAGAAKKYWKLTGDVLSEMSAGEKTAVDAAITAAAKTAAKADAHEAIDGNGGYQLRAVAKLLVDEINTLRQWLTSFKTEVAAATNLANLQSRVAGLPATPNRTLAQAKTAYDNLIDGSDLDE